MGPLCSCCHYFPTLVKSISLITRSSFHTSLHWFLCEWLRDRTNEFIENGFLHIGFKNYHVLWSFGKKPTAQEEFQIHVSAWSYPPIKLWYWVVGLKIQVCIRVNLTAVSVGEFILDFVHGSGVKFTLKTRLDSKIGVKHFTIWISIFGKKRDHE